MPVYTDFELSSVLEDAFLISDGNEDVSDYERIIELIDFDGRTVLATLSGSPTDTRNVTDFNFELLLHGGCGSASMTLSDEFYITSNITPGLFVRASYKTGDIWYFGRIQEVNRNSISGVTVSIYGLWQVLNEVSVGGTDFDFGDRKPDVYAASDFFPNDVDRSIQSFNNVSNYPQLIEKLYTNYIANTPLVSLIRYGTVEDPDPGRQFPFGSTKFNGDQSLSQVVRSAAMMMQDSSFGIDEDGVFFLKQIRNTLAGVFREASNTRDLSVKEERALVFTRIQLTGGYINSPDFQPGYYRYQAQLVEQTSKSIYGDRKVTLNIPWIRTDREAYNFARGFFNSYGRLRKRVTFTTCAQNTLIKPWNAKLRIENRFGVEVTTDVISSVKVTFNAYPYFTFDVGPEDLQFPETQQPEQWEQGPPAATGKGGGGGPGGIPGGRPSYVNPLSISSLESITSLTLSSESLLSSSSLSSGSSASSESGTSFTYSGSSGQFSTSSSVTSESSMSSGSTGTSESQTTDQTTDETTDQTTGTSSGASNESTSDMTSGSSSGSSESATSDSQSSGEQSSQSGGGSDQSSGGTSGSDLSTSNSFSDSGGGSGLTTSGGTSGSSSAVSSSVASDSSAASEASFITCAGYPLPGTVGVTITSMGGEWSGANGNVECIFNPALSACTYRKIFPACDTDPNYQMVVTFRVTPGEFAPYAATLTIQLRSSGGGFVGADYSGTVDEFLVGTLTQTFQTGATFPTSIDTGAGAGNSVTPPCPPPPEEGGGGEEP